MYVYMYVLYMYVALYVVSVVRERVSFFVCVVIMSSCYVSPRFKQLILFQAPLIINIACYIIMISYNTIKIIVMMIAVQLGHKLFEFLHHTSHTWKLFDC